ncbi:MAG TPA: DUF3592 domain-containing protein [Actinomycetota bacterium]
MWDLEAGKPLGGPLEGHHDVVKAVAVGQLGGRPIAVSGGCDQLVWVWVWDLAAGGPLGEPLVHNHFVNAVGVGELHDRSLAASSDAEETVRPATATALPDPGPEAATTLGPRRVDQGGSADSGERSYKASRRRDRRAASARGSGAVTTKPRSSQVGRSVKTGRRVRSVTGLQLLLIGLMLLGVVMVGFGVKMLVDTRRFLATAEVAKGVVVRVDKSVSTEWPGSGNNRHPVHVTHNYPVVEFVTAREQVAQFQADNGSLRVGDSVRLLYDPANPRNARLDNWGNRWAGFLALTGAGLAILVVNGLVYLILLWGRAA